MLSGGLPRDLLRAVLSLATIASTEGLDDLPTLARKMIGQDMRSVLTAQLRQAEVAAEVDGSPVISWLAQAADAEPTSTVLEQIAHAAPSAEAGTPLARLASQAGSYACYAATLLHAFAEATPATVAWLSQEAETSQLDLLTTARACLATSADSALTKVQRFREAAPFLQPFPDPLVVRPSGGRASPSDAIVTMIPAAPESLTRRKSPEPVRSVPVSDPWPEE